MGVGATALLEAEHFPWHQQGPPVKCEEWGTGPGGNGTLDPLCLLSMGSRLKPCYIYPKGNSELGGEPQYTFSSTLSFIKTFHFLKGQTAQVSI